MQTRQSLFSYLDALGIAYTTYDHAPVFKVQDAHEILVDLPAFGPCKSLFLKDKKQLSNNATTLLAPNDLVKFIESCGNRLEWF
jgi:hypothetical protein